MKQGKIAGDEILASTSAVLSSSRRSRLKIKREWVADMIRDVISLSLCVVQDLHYKMNCC